MSGRRPATTTPADGIGGRAPRVGPEQKNMLETRTEVAGRATLLGGHRRLLNRMGHMCHMTDRKMCVRRCTFVTVSVCVWFADHVCGQPMRSASGGTATKHKRGHKQNSSQRHESQTIVRKSGWGCAAFRLCSVDESRSEFLTDLSRNL